MLRHTAISTTAVSATLALLAAPVLAGGHATTMGYALTEEGRSLLVMTNIDQPGEVYRVDLTTPVRAIAWRPVTQELIGFADGKIVTIDPATGATDDQEAVFMDDAAIDADAMVAFDFNNKIDAVRAVGSSGENLVYFPTSFGDDRANSVRRFTDLFYEDGDMSEGTVPLIFANAYTNAINGTKASGTFQYALDARTNALVSLANNAGALASIGAITIDGAPADILPMGGFDIVSPEEGTDAAYAVLHVKGQASAGLYEIDVANGAATLLADLGISDISSFAVSMGM